MYRAPRGTTDILPQEQAYWRYIEQAVAKVCQLYGYERIDLPVLEDTQLFARSVGEETDIVTKEMYTFEDRGGNQLTLRPEGTAPVCRAYLEHGLRNLPLSLDTKGLRQGDTVSTISLAMRLLAMVTLLLTLKSLICHGNSWRH